jgi:hypothetical protein
MIEVGLALIATVGAGSVGGVVELPAPVEPLTVTPHPASTRPMKMGDTRTRGIRENMGEEARRICPLVIKTLSLIDVSSSVPGKSGKN